MNIHALRDQRIAAAMADSTFSATLGRIYQAARDQGMLETPLHDAMFAQAENQTIEIARYLTRVEAAFDVSQSHGIDMSLVVRLVNDLRLNDVELIHELNEIGRRTFALAGGIRLSVLNGGLRDE